MRLQISVATYGLATLLALCLGGAALAQQPAKKPDPATPVCANCHEDKHTSILLTAHGARNDAQGSMCQACHGDASEHLKDPTKAKPPNLIVHGTAAQKTAVCLTCHQTGRHLAFWESGKHALNDVPCTACHSIHGKDRAPDDLAVRDDLPPERVGALRARATRTSARRFSSLRTTRSSRARSSARIATTCTARSTR